MKKIGLVAAILSMVLVVTSFTYSSLVLSRQLPAEALQFLNDNFTENPVAMVEKDINYFSIDYNVKLSDGAEIHFDKKGNWKKVDCKHQTVPVCVIPNDIADFVSTNISDASIVKIQKKHKAFNVRLSNGEEMKFKR